MTLSQRLLEYVSACFTGLWIESHEHEDALREIAQMCRQGGRALSLPHAGSEIQRYPSRSFSKSGPGPSKPRSHKTVVFRRIREKG